MFHAAHLRKTCLLLLVFSFSLPLLSCSEGETTPKGIIYQQDLRPWLPPEVAAKAPPEEDVEQHQAEIRRIGDSKASVLITWTTFKDGQSSYLLSVEFLVTQAAPGTKLRASIAESPTDMGLAEALAVKIAWERPGLFSKQSGTESMVIYSTGEWKP